MSLVDIRGYNFIPGMMARAEQSMFTFYATLDADGELCGSVFYTPKTGTISKIGIRTRTVTTTDTIKVSIQGVDESTGGNDGVIAASGTVTTPASATMYWVELDTPLAVTMGQKRTVVMGWDDFVGEGSDGNLQIFYGISGFPAGGSVTPYTFTYVGSVLTLLVYSPNFGLEYDDGTIEPIMGCFPSLFNSNSTWDMNDNPDRRGIRLQVPYACRAIGAIFQADLDGNASLILYDSDGITPVPGCTITFDSDVRSKTSTNCYFAHFTSTKVLTKDTYYRLVLLPTTGTDINSPRITVTDDGANPAMNAVDGGEYFHLTTCNGVPTDETDWTQTLTTRPIMGLVVDRLDDVGDEKTFNLHVRDKDGVNLKDAYVVGEDAIGGAFGVLTGVDGTITEQTLTENSPYTFTISKANYETLVMGNITIDGPTDWELELLPALSVADVTEGTVFGESKTGTFIRNTISGAIVIGQDTVGTVIGE